MPPPGRADRASLRRIVERGRRIRSGSGARLPAGWVREHAESAGVADSTLLRMLKDGVPRDRPARARWKWEEPDDRAAFYRAAGQVGFARSLMERENPGRELPTLRTMQRAVRRDFQPDEIALAREGEAAARAQRVSITFDAPHRNAVWITDHSRIDINTVPLRGSVPVCPWMTLVQDDATRRILGASLYLGAPATTQILAAFGSAIAVAGAPREVQFDRGRDFLSGPVRQVAVHVGFAAVPVGPYCPHLKGKTENLNHTVQRWTGEELGVSIKPAKTVRNTDLLGTGPVFGFEDVSKAFFAAIVRHNERHRKRVLGRRTPSQAYLADDTPEEYVEPELLDRFMLVEAKRTVTNVGVLFKNQVYVCAEIMNQVGVKVEVRYRQDDLRTVRLFRRRDDGTTAYWCTAVARDQANHDQSLQLSRARSRGTERGKKDVGRAQRGHNVTHRSVVGPGPAIDTTVLSTTEYREVVGVDHAALADVVSSFGLETDA
jgi:putative transposase